MSALSTLEDVLPIGQVKKFGPGLRYGLEQVLQSLGINVNHGKDQLLSPGTIEQEVNGEWPDGRGAQLVILGTCEIECVVPVRQGFRQMVTHRTK
jgi:hypothetical protein